MYLQTSIGLLARDLLTRDEQCLDNDHERTQSVAYRLRRPLRLPDGRLVLPDDVVKRSAHVTLKEWPAGIDADIARLIHRGLTGPGITPSGAEPGRPSRRAVQSLAARLGIRWANSQAMCSAFKMEVLNGSHAFGAQGANAVRTVTTKDTFMMALYLATASRGAGDTVYNTTGELAGTGNYTQGGAAVTNATAPALDSTTAHWTPSASVSWTNLTSSGAFDAALLYNDASTSKLACAVFTFSSQSITAGTFSLTMPTNDGTTGLIRIA